MVKNISTAKQAKMIILLLVKSFKFYMYLLFIYESLHYLDFLYISLIANNKICLNFFSVYIGLMIYPVALDR